MINLPKNEVTAEAVAKENWDAIQGTSPLNVECINGHAFTSLAKFSGYLVAIVSKDPCPSCGAQELRRYTTDWEHQSFTNKDVG
jgi:hypothetical protein